MSRLLSMLAVAALSAGLAEPAFAAPVIASDDAVMAADAAALGVLQQGKGGGQGGGQGGAQETRGGGRGQGGGGEARGGGRGQGGGGQDRQEARGNRGGGNSSGGQARQSGEVRGQGSSARGSGSGNGRSSGGSARSEERGNSGNSSARNEARDNSGNSSARSETRGNSGNSSARNEMRGNSGNASGRNETRGNSGNASASGNSGRGNSVDVGRARHRLGSNDLRQRIAALPEPQRRMANSSRASERMAAGAIARGHARGLAPDAFDVRNDNGLVRILNRRGALLWEADDRRAGDLGSWTLRRLGDQTPRANAPAFCRSGEGHPVWGREWCIEKGFGLGYRNGTIWSRGGIGDVIFRAPDYRTRLDRGGLIGVLGDIVFGRLALQSVALGYDEPLTGYWVADPSGPYILRVRSGDNDVAEFYDRDRDDRVEVLYVVQPVW